MRKKSITSGFKKFKLKQCMLVFKILMEWYLNLIPGSEEDW